MKQARRRVSRPGFSVQILLLLLSDTVDAVVSKFPMGVPSSSFPGGEAVKGVNKDVVTAPSSGMTVAFVQKGEMNQGGRQSNAASLEAMAMSMAAMGGVLSSTPEVVAGMHEIGKIVNETLADLYSKYWYDVGQEPLLYEQWQNSTDACTIAFQKGSLADMSQKHLNCRMEQAKLQIELDSTTKCSVEYQAAYVQLRHAKCDFFWNMVNIFPRKHFPDECKRELDENNDHYVSRVVNDFYTHKVVWNDSYIQCKKITDEFAKDTEYCSNLTQELANKIAECDAIQHQLDATSCNNFMGEQDVSKTLCDEYERCWNRANETYIRENASIAKTELDVEGEIRSMKRVRCICRALELPDSDVEQGLEVCANTNFTTDDCYPNPAASTGYQCSSIGPPIKYSYYLDDWNPPNTPTLPLIPPNCTSNGVVMKPCTPEYVETHYIHLPSNALAATSNVPCCTMCNFFDGCGVDLLRPYASLIKGFDKETCCLKPQWVKGPWSPTYYGQECPTTCGHSAQYYQRVITCQNDLGAQVPEAECVKQLGSKDSTALECSATENCIECSTCGWGYQREGCNAQAGYHGKCVLCQKFQDHYFVTNGSCEQKQCQLCNITGQYRADCLNSFGNPGVCKPCTQKPGTYFVSPGTFVDFSCATNDCKTCRNGEYINACAGTFEGTCEPCQGADSSSIAGYQQYYFGPGAVANDPFSCPTSLCDYSICQFGSYLVNCGASNPGTCLPCQPECTFFADQPSCPATCNWNTMTLACEATSYVLSGGEGKCRFAPCENKVCGKGNYLAGCGGIRNGTCKPCYAAEPGRFYLDAGRYSPECPSQACQTCSVGMYRQNCSGTSGGVCTWCSPPPAGQYFSDHGGLTDNCPSQPCNGSVCEAGHYLYKCGGYTPGNCIMCTGLQTGYYWITNGGITNSCEAKQCDMSKCGIGLYLKNCGGHMSPAQPGTCEPCTPPPEHYYFNSNGGHYNDCKSSRCYDLPECPVGMYRAGCGGKDNPTKQGECVWCLNIAPGVTYLAGSGNATGFCEERSCDTIPNCDDGLMRGGCGAPDNPISWGSCNISCPAPGDGWYFFEGCVGKPCGACGSGQFRKGCGADALHISPGECMNCPDPPLGMFFDLTVATGCEPQNCSLQPTCGKGMYRANCGSRSQGYCAPCGVPDAGFYQVGEGSLTPDSCALANCNDLDPCAAGQYRKDCGTASYPQSIGHCAPCDPPPFGWYYDSPGLQAGNSTSCGVRSCSLESSCPPGWFRGGCGEDVKVFYNTIGMCKKCSTPPTGFYYISDGGIMDDCTKMSCTLTPQCELGFYRHDCGGPDTPTTYGNCVPCSPPIAGRFFIGHGFQNDSCSTSACSSAGECNAGEFRNKCGGENNPSSPGFCTACTDPLLPGNIWLTDGDFFDDCRQGPPPTTTEYVWTAR